MKDRNYILWVLAHALTGFSIYLLPLIAKIYALLIIVVGLYYVVKKRNKNNEVLLVGAYIVGSEVFLRMTGGSPNYEFAKYGVTFFLFLGMIYSGFSKNAISYWFFLLLLVPGVIIGANALGFTANVRTAIAFDISGSVCLGIASIYCYVRQITFEEINKLLLFMGLPIISVVTYLFFYTPNIKEVLTSTASNGDLSGGFGPNQVATALGLGMFIFFSRLIFASKTKITFFINLFLAGYVSYRGMLTFSRGGMITGFVMIVLLIFVIFLNSKKVHRLKLIYMISFLCIAMIFIWLFTSYKTGGYIDKRYANQDAMGRVKEDKFTGREKLAEEEIKMFLENPIFGVGVGKGTEIRTKRMGLKDSFASHDEITRLLAEHGSFGIMALLVLFFTPLFLYFDNRQHLYLICFLTFWFLTINHAAMRTASPAFIYALSLLKVRFEDEETALHRE